MDTISAQPAHVIEYLGRYTYKVAISNYRLLKVEGSEVTFKWKDYRHGAVTKKMTLRAIEFLRRFSLHILPHRYVRIRHYGILSSHGRAKIIPIQQKQQGCQTEIVLIVKRPPALPERCPKYKSTNLLSTILPKIRAREPKYNLMRKRLYNFIIHKDIRWRLAKSCRYHNKTTFIIYKRLLIFLIYISFTSVLSRNYKNLTPPIQS